MARPTGFPAGASPNPHSPALPAEYSGNKLDLAGRAIPPSRGSEALDFIAKSASLRRCLRPFPDHLAEFCEAPGSLAHLGPAHLGQSHTRAPPLPGPGCRPVVCQGKALGPEGRSWQAREQNWWVK